MNRELRNSFTQHGIEEIFGTNAERVNMSDDIKNQLHTGTVFIEVDNGGDKYGFVEETKTWYLQSNGGGQMYENATTEKDGLMSKESYMKLDGIEENANNYVHPTTHPATMIVEDTTHKFMTDTEKTKLSGIAVSANNYTHPSTHPATMIVEDTTHRFTTDAEKVIFNGKQNAIVAQNAIADLSTEADLATVITTLNSIIPTLRTVGIIKTS